MRPRRRLTQGIMTSVAQDTTGTPDLTPKPKAKATGEGENAEAPLWSTGGFGNDIATPEKAPEAEQRRADPEDEDIAEEPEYQGLSEELAIPERPHIRGLKTFGDKFMPFAAGAQQAWPGGGLGGLAGWGLFSAQSVDGGEGGDVCGGGPVTRILLRPPSPLAPSVRL